MLGVWRAIRGTPARFYRVGVTITARNGSLVAEVQAAVRGHHRERRLPLVEAFNRLSLEDA